MDPSGYTVYYATRIGARAADFPWNLRNTLNPLICQHACIAADFGMTLEPAGHWVLSEREIATGIDSEGDEIAAQLESDYNSNGRTNGKRPGVATLYPSGTDHIAVEAEQDEDRPISVYEQKLSAYASNSSLRAVWYTCASKTTANCVREGARKVFKTPKAFPLRIMTIPRISDDHSRDMNNLSE